jgi:hypothetical protein
MKSIDINILCLQDKFSDHKNIKDQLLDLINRGYSEKDLNKTDYYGDSISRYDWNVATDFNREWVRFLLPYIQKQFNKFAEKLEHKSPLIKKIWFQQYVKNDYHGWHTHGDNYTGVYYLDFPKGSSSTELIEQGSLNKIIIKAKEGDIVIFPSFVMHRSPRIKKDIQKTIISFNIDMNLINPTIFERIE